MIYDIFYVSQLNYNTTKKKQVNQKILPKTKREFKAGNNKKYEFKAIIDIAIYSKEATNNQIPSSYYFVL